MKGSPAGVSSFLVYAVRREILARFDRFPPRLAEREVAALDRHLCRADASIRDTTQLNLYRGWLMYPCQDHEKEA